MNNEKEHINGTVEKRRFVVDPDFKDPLVKSNLDEFDDVGAEQITKLYKVYLGIPIKQDEVLTNK